MKSGILLFKAAAWALLGTALFGTSVLIMQNPVSGGWIYAAVPGMVMGFILSVVSMYILTEVRSWHPLIAAPAAFMLFPAACLFVIPVLLLMIAALVIAHFDIHERVIRAWKRISIKKLPG